MPKIKILSKEVSELIAAGEVVERPSSVVKELLENSLDAGATKITVEIKNGGISYIRVTDNGCGIAREDIPAVFISHATSKISRREDLNAILTLGFRGEAMASIAAVSRVELLTKAEHEETGSRCCITAGEQEPVEDAGCPKGATIVVRDLFFNTPARMKFLKKDVSEANAVAGIVDRIALSNPGVSIRFIREGKSTLFTSGSGDLRTAAFEIFGRDFADGLVEAQYEYESVAVEGLVSKPVHSRPNRNMQFFFVNGRLVKTATASAALSEAYKNSVMVGKFPYCILNITTPPELLDVNVHPAKIEVRFANERSVFSAVYYAAKNALERRDEPPKVALKHSDPALYEPPRPETQQLEFPKPRADFWQHVPKKTAEPESTKSESPQRDEREEVRAEFIPPSSRVEVASPMPYISAGDSEPSSIADFLKNAASPPHAESRAPEPEPQESAAEEGCRIVGEAFGTYIIVEKGESLFLIDKHAAHERMLYNKLVESEGEIPTQLLLSPVTVTLSKEEYSAVLENLDTLRGAGFDAEDFGAGLIIVRECPMEVPADEVTDVVAELAGYLLENRRKLISEKKDWLFSLIACKSAIKAGYVTSRFEMEKFAAELFAHPEIRYCPHGRPVMIEMTRGELERSFGRA